MLIFSTDADELKEEMYDLIESYEIKCAMQVMISIILEFIEAMDEQIDEYRKYSNVFL